MALENIRLDRHEQLPALQAHLNSWHFAVCSRDPESQFSTLGIPLGLAREPRRAGLQFVVANAARERTDGALVESPRGFLPRSSFMRSATI
jgi:hypothetical protein